MGKETTTTKSKSAHGAGWLVNLMSFAAVCCIGVALILSKIGALGGVAGALMTIAQTVAYLVVTVVSFFYVYQRKNVWLWVTWIVAVVLIVLYYIF